MITILSLPVKGLPPSRSPPCVCVMPEIDGVPSKAVDCRLVQLLELA
jgi:hypothetical protein